MHDGDVLSLGVCKTVPWIAKGLVMLAACHVIAVGGADAQMAWRPEDMSRIDTPADDRPNEESRKMVTQYYTPILKDLFVLGDNQKIGFRLFPRNEHWTGLLLTTPEGKPIEAPKRGLGQYRIDLVNPDAKPAETPEKSDFVHYNNSVLFSDASRYFRPRTEIKVYVGTNLLDRAVMDFRSLVFQDSKVQMSAFNEGPTQKSGFIRPKDSDLIREDGRRMFLWGGHENHIPSKTISDAYAEVYPEAGLNVFRHLGAEEAIKNPETVELDPEQLDKLHYLIYKLGQRGISYLLSHFQGYVPGGLLGYSANRENKELDGFRFWTDPIVRNAYKKFWKGILTSINPYTGKALKDDPILVGVELACETGLGGRYFDYNKLDGKGGFCLDSAAWHRSFNEYLLKKYGALDNGKLKDTWSMEQVFKWEDPAKNTIPIPWRFRGDRGYGDWGEVIGTYYLDGTVRRASPRVSDLLEFTYEVQKDWFTDLATCLRDEIGVKAAIGATGPNWHICQIPGHKALMDSPCSLFTQANYCDWDCGAQLTSRLKNIKHLAGGYSYIYHRPTFAYEWGGWSTMGPFQYEWILMAALFGRVYGFDGFGHHKMTPIIYPVADPYYSLKVNTITPISDRPRRGAFYVCRWILERSKIEEIRDKILIGYPKQSCFTAGATRHFANPVFENWLMFQIGTEDYSFDEVYDGPTDRIVIHEGRGPYGDYSKAQHAILWCHSNTGRDGKDLEAKLKWFAKHGIVFKPGQKYYVDDHYFATPEDMSDYLTVHEKAEHARQEALKEGKKVDAATKQTVIDVRDDYWAAELDAQPTELDRQLYEALKRWNYPLPFAVEDIDKVWRHRQKNMTLDSTHLHFAADRDDMQVWFGKGGKNTRVRLSKLAAETDEHQYAVALLPWDTAEFSSSKTLVVWCMWNSRITVTLSFPGKPKIYAVNWLGKRLFEVTPLEMDRDHLTFMSARHDDIFCYEIAR